MNNFENYWNEYYTRKTPSATKYECWIENYGHLIAPGSIALDLGCGIGVDAEWLYNHSVDVIASDFSKDALDIVSKRLPFLRAIRFDMTNKFPFESDCFDTTVANLSIHYFSYEVTKRIANEISRVLRKQGMLIACVNSLKDYAPLKDDIEIEPNFYFTNGCNRRYFSIDDIKTLFSAWEVISIQESNTLKYNYQKHTIDFVVRKR